MDRTPRLAAAPGASRTAPPPPAAADDRHLCTRFDAEIDAVVLRLRAMGGLVESQVAQALHALTQLSEKAAVRVLALEQQVNAMETGIDGEISSIIARRQPTARDLRLLLALSRSVSILERAGDEAARIARTARRLLGTGLSTRLPLAELATPGRLAIAHLHRALDAFARLDEDKAAELMRQDGQVGQEFENLMRLFVTYMMEDPRTVSASLDLLFVGRAIGHVDAHARQLAAQVLYAVRGTDAEACR